MIRAAADMTVLQLKLLVKQRDGTPTSQCQLRVKDTVLDNNRRLRDYGIVDGSSSVAIVYKQPELNRPASPPVSSAFDFKGVSDTFLLPVMYTSNPDPPIDSPTATRMASAGAARAGSASRSAAPLQRSDSQSSQQSQQSPDNARTVSVPMAATVLPPGAVVSAYPQPRAEQPLHRVPSRKVAARKQSQPLSNSSSFAQPPPGSLLGSTSPVAKQQKWSTSSAASFAVSRAGGGGGRTSGAGGHSHSNAPRSMHPASSNEISAEAINFFSAAAAPRAQNASNVSAGGVTLPRISPAKRRVMQREVDTDPVLDGFGLVCACAAVVRATGLLAAARRVRCRFARGGAPSRFVADFCDSVLTLRLR